jgi:tetratricopeptide (TPR) repeat protein
MLISSGTIYYSYIFREAQLFENEINIDYKLPEKEQKLSSAYIESKMPEFIKVNLNAVPFYELLGKYYFKEKQYDKANACFNLSEKINPYSGKSEYFRNEIAKERGFIDSAYFYTKRSLETRPRCESYFYETISTAILFKDTINIFKLHYDFTKYRNDPKYWINTSSALILSKCSYKNSIKFIDEGLKFFPNDTTLIERRNSFEFDVVTKKAAKLMNEKKYSEAIKIYNVVLKKDNNNIKTLQNIGLCYGGMKDYKNAIFYLEKTLRLKSDDAKTNYYLGVCYYEIKNKVKGCYYINLAAEKNYQNSISIRNKYCK